MLTNDLWKEALRTVQNYAKNKFVDKLKYGSETLKLDHACPPPISDDLTKDETDITWNGERVLWCYPGAPHLGGKLKHDEKIPVESLGSSLWLILHALKELKQEKFITKEEIEKLKRLSFNHSLGFAHAFNELNWSKHMYTDPSLAKEGDVGVLKNGEEMPHFWFIVGNDPHVETKLGKSLKIWSATPELDGVGFDYRCYNNKEQRKWILTRPFI